MKTIAPVLAFAGAVAALATPVLPHGDNANVVQAASATYTPARFTFNIRSSDGNYLGQKSGSIGATLTSAPSGFRYSLTSNGGLDSTSSDHLSCGGGGGNCIFFQNTGTSTCNITGTYPNYTFGCALETGGSFGNNNGYLAYGTPSELASRGATPITLTVAPCNC